VNDKKGFSMSSSPMSPIWVFISAFGVSSFAGLAALLRAGKEVNWISVASSVLNSGLFGLAIALLWYVKFQDNIYFLIGICILAGLGGATLVDFFIQAFKQGGISVGGIMIRPNRIADPQGEEKK
jgi:uncharacterized membrane-anchored protein